MANMTREQFVSTYVPMALEGKNALEIANSLGLEGDEQKKAKYVSIRASQIRQELKENTEKKAKAQGLTESETQKELEKVMGMVPKLKTRKREKDIDSFQSYLENLLENVDK